MPRTHEVVKDIRQQIIGEAYLLSGYIFKALIFYFMFLIYCYLFLGVSDNLEVVGSTAVYWGCFPIVRKCPL